MSRQARVYSFNKTKYSFRELFTFGLSLRTFTEASCPNRTVTLIKAIRFKFSNQLDVNMFTRNVKLSVLVFVALMVFIISQIFMSESRNSQDFTPLFTDAEIEMLNNYNSSLYKPLGSTSETSETSEVLRYFNYFDIPDSVKNNYEFTFYLLEFNEIRELHAYGYNPVTQTSFLRSKPLQPDYTI